MPIRKIPSVVESPSDNRPPQTSIGELVAALALFVLFIFLMMNISETLQARRYGNICLANLHEIGEATSLYLQDYDETFPPAWDGCVGDNGWEFGTWQDRLSPYTESTNRYRSWFSHNQHLWHCPADKVGDKGSYGVNAWIAGAFSRLDCALEDRSPLWMDSLNLSQLSAPSRILWGGDTNKEWKREEVDYGVVFADWMRKTDGPLQNRTTNEMYGWFESYIHTDYTDVRGDCPYPGRYGCKGIAYRHERRGTGTGKANVLFCDGHVENVPFGTLEVTNLIPEGLVK